jgi:hypothetical protein
VTSRKIIAYILALFLKSTSNSSLRFLEIALPMKQRFYCDGRPSKSLI